MNTLHLVSRILWFFTMLLISVLCMCYYNSFTYQQVVLANLFPSLGIAAKILVYSSLPLSIVLMSVSVFIQYRNKIKYWLLSILLLGLVLVPIVFIFKDKGLPNSSLSGFLGLFSCIYMLLPSTVDLCFIVKKNSFNGCKSLPSPDKDFHLFLSLIFNSSILFLALIFWGPSIPSNIDHLPRGIIMIFLIALLVYSILTLVFRISERSKDYLKTEWFSFSALFAAFIFWTLKSSVFVSIAFVGIIPMIYAFFISIGIVAFLMSFISFFENEINSNLNLTGLRLLFFPLGIKSMNLFYYFLYIVFLSVITSVLISKISLMDWNFLGQKAILTIGLILVMAQSQWVLPIKAPPWFHVSYPFIFGLISLLIFTNIQESIVKSNINNNVVFKMSKTLLTSNKNVLNQNFFRFLQSNTNIPKSKKVIPPDISFTEEENSLGKLSPTQQKRYNIIIMVVDSLRPDYLSPYNPEVGFTPKIDDFAKDSFVFKKVFSRYGATGLSEPSIWTGAMMIHQQYVSPFYTMNSLQRLIDVNSYRTYVSMDSILSQILKQNDSLKNLDPGVSTQDLDLCTTVSNLINEINLDNSEKPFFVYTQPQNLHISVLNRKKEINRELSDINANINSKLNKPYALSLNRLDSCFGDLISYLKKANIYDNTIIILTSDHGDSLGEDGRYGHAYTLFPEIVKIPLIMRLPSELKVKWQTDLNQLAFSIDITPSLYSLLGYKTINKNWIQGQSLLWPSNTKSTRQNFEPYLLASSYGPVYGLLSNEGNDLYIVDAVNLVDYSYDLRTSRPILKAIDNETRKLNSNHFIAKIKELNNLFQYRESYE